MTLSYCNNRTRHSFFSSTLTVLSLSASMPRADCGGTRLAKRAGGCTAGLKQKWLRAYLDPGAFALPMQLPMQIIALPRRCHGRERKAG